MTGGNGAETELVDHCRAPASDACRLSADERRCRGRCAPEYKRRDEGNEYRDLRNERHDIEREKIIALYRANGWSAADKPAELYNALRNCDCLVTAWDGDKLVGLGNAISDGHLVVYYPHLLVHPAYQGNGIGRMIVARLQERYGHFHMQMLVADREAVDFYEKVGFTRAGDTQPM